MNTSQKIQLDPSLLYSTIGEEVVLLTVDSGKYFKVNSIGSRIWELIKEPITIDKVCNNLTEEYDVSREQCLEEMIPFLEKLNEDKLLLLS